jgi:hypothetical protein
VNDCTRAGTALWEQVLAVHRRGGPGPAEQVEAEWARLTAEQQAAATKAGTALWHDVATRGNQP